LTGMDPATDWVGGERGWALNLDGTNDFIDCGGFGFGDTAGTIAIRLRLSTYNKGVWFSWGQGSDLATLQVRASGDGDADASEGDCWPQFRVYDVGAGGSTNSTIRATTTTLVTGQWYTILCGSDGSSYFVDVDGRTQGVEVDAGSNNGAWPGDLTWDTDTEHTAVGARWASGSWGGYLAGDVACAMYWDRALPVAARKAIAADPYRLWRPSSSPGWLYVSGAAAQTVTLSDSLTLSDSMTTVYAATMSLADSMTLADAITVVYAATVTIADTLTLSDAVTQTVAAYVVALADGLGIADAITASGAYSVTLADGITLADVIVATVPSTVRREVLNVLATRHEIDIRTVRDVMDILATRHNLRIDTP